MGKVTSSSSGRIRRLVGQVNHQFQARVGAEHLDQLAVHLWLHLHRQQPIFQRIVAEDIGEGGGDDGLNAPTRQRPRSMLAG